MKNIFGPHFEKYRQNGMDYLRANVPEVQRLESFKGIDDLKLIIHQDLEAILVLSYEAIAPKLFPHVRKKLIEMGMCKRHNICSTYGENEDTPKEIYHVQMGFYGAKLQFLINFRKKSVDE